MCISGSNKRTRQRHRRRETASGMARSGRVPVRRVPTRRSFRRYQYPDARTSISPHSGSQSESDLLIKRVFYNCLYFRAVLHRTATSSARMQYFCMNAMSVIIFAFLVVIHLSTRCLLIQITRASDCTRIKFQY